MDQLKALPTLIPGVLIPISVLALALWKVDVWLSDAGAKRLYGAISGAANAPQDSALRSALEAFLDRYFSLENGWPSFLKNVLLLTLVSMLFLLSIYVAVTPDLKGQLLTKGFLKQFFGNGFVVTFVVNCFVLSQYKTLVRSFVSDSIGHNLLLIALDVVLKAIIFIVLTMLTYFVFALTSDAFGENIRVVPKVSATTILHAIGFRNLTSVYLYSLVLSSFPVFVVVLIKMMLVSPAFAKAIQAIFFYLPFEGKPLRAISVVFSVLAALFALAFALLLSWVQG